MTRKFLIFRLDFHFGMVLLFFLNIKGAAGACLVFQYSLCYYLKHLLIKPQSVKKVPVHFGFQWQCCFFPQAYLCLPC